MKKYNKEENKAEIKTCRHFRFLVPNEHANEMALADPERCELCYRYIKNHWVSLDNQPTMSYTLKHESVV